MSLQWSILSRWTAKTIKYSTAIKYRFRLGWSSALGKFFEASLFSRTAYDLIFLIIDTITNTVDYMRTYRCCAPLNTNSTTIPSKVILSSLTKPQSQILSSRLLLYVRSDSRTTESIQTLRSAFTQHCYNSKHELWIWSINICLCVATKSNDFEVFSFPVMQSTFIFT